MFRTTPTTRKRLATRLGVPVAAIALAAASAAGAYATGMSYTVAVGGSTASASHPISADDNNGVTFRVQNAGGVRTMPCTDVHIPDAEVQSGTGVVDIARFSNSTWNGCEFSGIALTVTQTSEWSIHGTGSATSGTEVVTGHVDGIFAHVEATADPSLCSFDVAGSGGSTDPGSAEAAFDESTPQTVNVNETGFDGSLTVYNVNGCLGAIANGDPAEFVDGDFAVTSPDGAINLQ